VREYLAWSRRAHQGPGEQSSSVPSPPPRLRVASQLQVVPPPAVVEQARARAQAEAAARRRRLLTVVVAAVAAPALVALATGSDAAWWGFLVLVPVVLAYLGILFRNRRRMAEREFNVAFFGKSRRGAAGLEEVFPGDQTPRWGEDQWDGLGTARASSAR
jgi:hypothetical protein